MRPSWDEYFMEMAELAAKRSACLRGHVGAVIVKDRHVLATGYNGPPRGLPACCLLTGDLHKNSADLFPTYYDGCNCNGCIRTKMHVPSGQNHELCRGLHAEQNAIIQAAYHGVSVNGAVIYSSLKPCSMCVKSIINAGIKEALFKGNYSDKLTDLFAEQGNLKLTDLTIRPTADKLVKPS